MFGHPKKKPFIPLAQLATLIAEGVEIDGDVVFADGMRIDGRVRATSPGPTRRWQAPSLLVLSARGRIEGRIRCGDAVINGTVTGDLDVDTASSCSRRRACPARSATASCRWTWAPPSRASWCGSRRSRRRGNVVELGADKAVARCRAALCGGAPQAGWTSRSRRARASRGADGPKA